jgi:hypothetical protein
LSIGGIQLIEQRREFDQSRVSQVLDDAQGVIRWNQRLWVNERQHAGLLVGPSTHRRHLRRRWLHNISPTHPTGRPGVAHFNTLLV